MKPFGAALLLDFRLQYRSKLYHIGFPIAALLGLSMRFLIPAELVPRVLPALYLVAIGGTTFMFGAGMLLLEKSERTIEALAATPLTGSAYLASKAITLTGFAAVEAATVYLLSARGVPANFPTLIAGVLVLGVAYTFLGLGQAASHDSVTGFLFPDALLMSLVLQAPFLYALGIGPPAIWYLVPTQAPLLLMIAAFEPSSPWQWSYAIAVSALLVSGAYGYARVRMRAHAPIPGLA